MLRLLRQEGSHRRKLHGGKRAISRFAVLGSLLENVSSFQERMYVKSYSASYESDMTPCSHDANFYFIKRFPSTTHDAKDFLTLTRTVVWLLTRSSINRRRSSLRCMCSLSYPSSQRRLPIAVHPTTLSIQYDSMVTHVVS